MKQLLIVIGLVSILSLNAQNIYAMPAAQMSSTSAMVGSGSSLPQAAISGTQTTYDSEEGFAPSNAPKKSTGEGRPEDWEDPYEDPIGDAVLPLLLMAAGYAICAWRRSKLVRTPDSGRQR